MGKKTTAVDERRSLAHRLRRLLGGSFKVLARVRADVTRQVDVPATLGAQPIQLLALVSLSAIAYEIGVRVINRPRLATLAARDRTSLLRQVRTGEMVGQVRAREGQGAVSETKHRTNGSRGGYGSLTSRFIIVGQPASLQGRGRTDRCRASADRARWSKSPTSGTSAVFTDPPGYRACRGLYREPARCPAAGVITQAEKGGRT